MLTDVAGARVQGYDYKPYGAVAQSSGAVENAIQYGGHRNDGATELIYMGARYYDPKLTRFVSADSIVPDPENPQALNRYAYAYNNPISNVDPTGNFPVLAVVALVATKALSAAWAALPLLSKVAFVAGAAVTGIGYATKTPALLGVGAILLGFAGGYALGAPGVSAVLHGVVGGAVGALTSPISPLDSSVRMALGWAWTAYGMLRATTPLHPEQIKEIDKI
jgi:RHS repeat-associated protein